MMPVPGSLQRFPRLAHVLLSFTLLLGMVAPLGVAAQAPFSDDPTWAAAPRLAGPFYEACVFAGSLSQVRETVDPLNPTLVCGRGTVLVFQGGTDYYACLYAGSLSRVGTTQPTCSRGIAIGLAAGVDYYACLYAGSLSQVGTNASLICGRGTAIGLQGVFNRAPETTPDAYETDEDTPLIVAAPGVLGNDIDPEGDPMTAQLGADVANGSLALHADGSFSYTPNANFYGSDSFTYRAVDAYGAASALTTVTLTVHPVNDTPVATNDSYTIGEDTQLVIGAPGVLGNDSDVDNDPLTAVQATGPSHGSLTLNADGSFTYTPDENFNGQDSFTYTANDGTVDSNVATVNITVNPINDAPSAVDDSYGTAEDTPLVVAAPGVLGNDSDVENDTLTAVLATGVSNGTLTLNPDGSFTYTPNDNFNGIDSFTYRANDGALNSAVATVTITVSSANDVPVAVNDSFATDEDIQLVIPAPGVLANDTDVENDPLTSLLAVGPSHGSLTLNPDGSFTYTPDANYNGLDSFTYQANDGTANSNVATVNITVNAINDPPLAVLDGYSTDGVGSLSVPAPGVLGNDTDVENDPLTAVLVTGPSQADAFTLNPDGSFSYTASSSATVDSFTYMANDGAADSNVVTVTITINAIPVADPQSLSTDEDTPLVITLSATDTDDENLTFAIATPPGDGGVGAITAIDCTGVNTCTASVTYTPDPNFNGSDSFTFTVNDGHTDSAPATIAIAVGAVNDPPSFTKGPDVTVLEDAGPQTENPWATDISRGAPDEAGQALTFVVTNNTNPGLFSAGPAVSPSGVLTFTPALNANGAATITLELQDDGGGTNTSPSQDFVITVTPVNDAPSFTPGSDVTVSEDSAPYSAAWASAISAGPNEGSQVLTFVVDSNSNPSLFSVEPAIASNGTLTFTLAPDAFGTATLQVRLTDDGGTANGGVNTTGQVQLVITVSAVNDAPTFTGGQATKVHNATAHLELTVTQDLLYDAVDKPNEVSAGSVLSARVANDPLSAQLANGTELTTSLSGKVTITATGFVYEPPAAQTGVNDTASYFICDTGVPAPGLCTQLTLSFAIGGELAWFINGAAPTNGNGTMFAPFNSIANFNAYNTPNAVTTAGDVVFLYSGTYTDGIVLVAGQRLFGQGAPGGTVFTTATGLAEPVTGSAYPTIVGTAPNVDSASGFAVSLNSTGGNNTLRFLTLGTVAAKAASGIVGTSFGTLTVGDVSIDTDGQAISLITGTLAPTGSTNGFGSVSSVGGSNNVLMSSIGTSATFAFGTGAFSGAAGNGIYIEQQSGSFTFGQTIQNTNAGSQSVSILNRTGGTIEFSGAINPTGGLGDAPAANSRGISIVGSAGTYTFSGPQVKINSSTISGVTVSGTATVEFTAGRLVIVSTTGNGLSATGGTLRVAGANNSISSGTGIALNVSGAVIGTGGLTFVSINATGGANGIVLSNTGATAGLTVTGNGGVCTSASPTTCSGGTINGSNGADGAVAGSGIYLNNTSNVSLSLMRITGTHQNYGIRGTTVTNVTMTSLVLDGTFGNQASMPHAEGVVIFNELLGTSSISTSYIRGGLTDNVRVVNSSGTGTLNITSTTIRENDATGCGGTGCGNDGINFEATGSANMTLDVNGGTFAVHKGDHVNILPQGSGDIDVTLEGITFSGGHAQQLGGGITMLSGGGFSGTLDYNVLTNTITGTQSGGAMHFNKGVSSGGTFRGTVSDNNIGTSGVLNSGCADACSGLRIEIHGGGSHIVHVLGNAIHGYNFTGIDVVAGEGVGTATGDVTIRSNTIGTPGPDALAGIYFNIGTISGNSHVVCADIGGAGVLANNAANSDGTTGIADIVLEQRTATTIRLPGYVGANNADALVVTYIQGRNNGPPSVIASNIVPTGGGFTGGAACASP